MRRTREEVWEAGCENHRRSEAGNTASQSRSSQTMDGAVTAIGHRDQAVSSVLFPYLCLLPLLPFGGELDCRQMVVALGWHTDFLFPILPVVKFNSADKTPLGKGKGELR